LYSIDVEHAKKLYPKILYYSKRLRHELISGINGSFYKTMEQSCFLDGRLR